MDLIQSQQNNILYNKICIGLNVQKSYQPSCISDSTASSTADNDKWL